MIRTRIDRKRAGREKESSREVKRRKKTQHCLPGSLLAESIRSMAGWVSQNMMSAVDADSTISPYVM